MQFDNQRKNHSRSQGTCFFLLNLAPFVRLKNMRVRHRTQYKLRHRIPPCSASSVNMQRKKAKTKSREKKKEKHKKEIEILFAQPKVSEYTLDDLEMEAKTEDSTEPGHKETC